MAIKEKETGFGKWKIIVSVLAVIVIVCAVGFGFVLQDSRSIGIAENVIVNIPSGSGASNVADILYQNNVIKYPKVFRLQSKLGGFDGQLQPGDLEITPGMSYNQILEAVSVSDRNTVKVVIPEGYEAKQIQQALRDAGLACADEFLNALDPSLYDYKFLSGIPERAMKLEGYLFPATYSLKKDISAQEAVDIMLKTFDETFKQEYYDRAAEMGKSVDEIITMASIIERETDAEGERAKVAGVFYNRINSGMKLQSCATVQYILGEHKPVLSIADTQIDSPYNTYAHDGLPIGPISNPGEECIKAALYPEDTDAYYFCLSRSGEHIFSTNYEDHVKAMESNDLITNVDSSALENEDSKK